MRVCLFTQHQKEVLYPFRGILVAEARFFDRDYTIADLDLRLSTFSNQRTQVGDSYKHPTCKFLATAYTILFRHARKRASVGLLRNMWYLAYTCVSTAPYFVQPHIIRTGNQPPFASTFIRILAV